MAAKMKKPSNSLRKIAKPVISTDVMGNRNVEIRAVGAWVQAEPPPLEPEAVLAAEQEESRLREMQREKQARLLQFQRDVKKRVQCLDRLKKHQQLQTNLNASEQERNIVSQSAFSSDDYAKRDKCLVRPMSALSVSKSTTAGTTHGVSIADPKMTEAFSDQTNQVHQHVRHAKKNLVSRQVITEHFIPDDLPGGVWKVSKTRDDTDITDHPASRFTAEAGVIELHEEDDDDDIIEEVKVINNKEYVDEKENLDHIQKSVQFELDEKPGEIPEKSNHRKHLALLQNRDRPHSSTSARVPNIYSGVENEEEKRRARSQQAMYRRLFMDIEREQVKENIRRQEHRKRIQRLKKEKEEERIREEQISQQLIEPRDPVTGETSIEALEREAQEAKFVRQTIREHERRVRKAKEMERYIEALRQQLKDKVRRKKIDLPPLCCCGDSLWDTNPETCANNCVFYKNPKEYGRALQAMLDSSEILLS